jgi:hypothetical protein
VIDKRTKRRLIFWSALSTIGTIGMSLSVLLTISYSRNEFRWHSLDQSYISKSIFLQKGKFLFWSVRRLPDAAPDAPDNTTLVSCSSLQKAKRVYEITQQRIEEIHADKAYIDPTVLGTERAGKQVLQILDNSVRTARERAILDASFVANNNGWAGFYFSYKGRPLRETFLQFPIWIMVLPFFGLCCTGLRARTIYRRARAGECTYCGYDLRASSGARCPECGASIPRETPRRGLIGRMLMTITRHKMAAVLTFVAVVILALITASFWHPFHYDRWPVSDIIAAPAPRWTHIMLFDGCISIIKTESGNPPEYALDQAAYASEKTKYETLLRKEAPSGFMYDKKMIVPADGQSRLKEARARLIETMMNADRGLADYFPYQNWSATSPETQRVFNMPLWPIVLMLAAYPGILLGKRMMRR